MFKTVCVVQNLRIIISQKYAQIFVIRQNLFLKIEENCSFFRTGNIHGRISGHMFAPNGLFVLVLWQTL